MTKRIATLALSLTILASGATAAQARSHPYRETAAGKAAIAAHRAERTALNFEMYVVTPEWLSLHT